MPTFTWLSRHDTKEAAYEAQRSMALLLVAKGLTPQHTIDVRYGKGGWWTVLVVDDRPEEEGEAE